MRLSELLGAEVTDEQGRPAGRVHDVRLTQDGPVIGGFGARFRLAGLVVGKRALGARLGYDRGDMHGPWLVKAIAGSLHRQGRYVEWGRVQAVEPGRIRISGSADDLPQPDPSD
jgi:hypothetical protein